MALVPTIKTTITPKDGSKLTERERQLIKERTPLGLSRAALKGIEIIQNRLDQGEGPDGALKPYSSAYLQRRKERKPIDGQAPTFTDPSTVNLTWSGDMRSSITSDYNERFARIFFSRAAEGKKAAMLQKTRPFFGLNTQDEARLTEVFRKYVFRGFER